MTKLMNLTFKKLNKGDPPLPRSNRDYGRTSQGWDRFWSFNAGDAIIEVLVAIGIVSVCLVALSIAMVTAINNSRFSKESSLASQYAQEGIEASRKARDRASDWTTFTTGFNTGENCLDSNNNWTACDCDSITTPNVGIFYRCARTVLNGEKMTITINVSWTEGGRNHNVQAITVLSKWNK